MAAGDGLNDLDLFAGLFDQVADEDHAIVGINHNTVWRIEGGDSIEVHPRTIRKIAEALSVDPASLTLQE